MTRLRIHRTVITAVVFDFDGTLARLNIDFDQMRQAVSDLSERYGFASHVLKARHILEQIHEAEAILAVHSLQRSQAYVKEAYALIKAIELAAAAEGEVFSGVRPLLGVLRTHGIRTGIISRNCKRAVHTVFPDLSDFCRVVLCRDDVPHVKPHPDHLLRAISFLKAEPAQTVMIGDHPLDIETGRAAGTFTLGVLSGRCLPEDFKKAGADGILESATDLISKFSV